MIPTRTASLALGLSLVLGGLTACKKEETAPQTVAEANAMAMKAMAEKESKKKAEASHDGHDHGDHGDHKGMKEKAGDMTVYFVYPQDGSTVPETFDVAFGLKGYTLTPAGKHIEDKTRGHHHVIIDGGPIPEGQAVPVDDTHIHYGGGQSHATLNLTPGKHTLTMQFADGAHISYGPKAAKTVNVTVKEGIGEAKVSFLSPKDGAKVKSPLKVRFGLEGMKIRPAGEDTLDKTTGHHHLIIDGEAPGVGDAVPADETHIHYGKGQTEAEITLSPGEHTLTMQLADGAHLSYGPRLSETIKVTVIE